jgi:aspartate-semialdehyde dehydrogenase
MIVALKPIHDAARIKRIVVSPTRPLRRGRRPSRSSPPDARHHERQKPVVKVYPHQIAFNCLPHIDVFLENGYTKEEMKMVNETKKILHDPGIAVTATTVRVPVFHSHSESVNVETVKKITAAEVRKLLSTAPGVKVVDEPIQDLSAGDRCGRGRRQPGGADPEDESIPNGINLWVVADNIRKGAALNAVQIAEILIQKYL